MSNGTPARRSQRGRARRRASPRPRAARGHRRRPARRRRRRTCSAAPSAVPASPAAGCTQTSSNGRLAPDARVGNTVQRGAAGHGQHPVAGRSCSQRARSTSTSSRRLLHASGEVGVRRGSSPSSAARRRAHCGPVGRLGDEAAVTGRRGSVSRSCVQEARLAVGGQRHHLVLVAGAQEPEVLGQRLVQQAERVRQRLAGQDLQPAVVVAAGEVGGALAAAVAAPARCSAVVTAGAASAGRGGVRDVVGHEPAPARGPGRAAPSARNPGACSAYMRAQVVPRVGQAHVLGRLGQAPGRRSRRRRRGPAGAARPRARHQRIACVGQLPGRERHRPLAVLAPAEAFLLGGGDDLRRR